MKNQKIIILSAIAFIAIIGVIGAYMAYQGPSTRVQGIRSQI